MRQGKKKDINFSMRGSVKNKIALLRRYVERGFLLHGSGIKVDILRPFLAYDTWLPAGNFRAVYATDDLDFAVNKTLLSLNSEDKLYIYVCDPDIFTKISHSQYISIASVSPIHRTSFDSCQFLPNQRRSEIPQKAPLAKRIDSFFSYSINKYFEFADQFLIDSELHGWRHAFATASFGAMLCACECPKYYKEVLAGCFLHDIARRDDGGGNSHAFESAAMATEFLRQMRGVRLHKKIIHAIRHHADGALTHDEITGCIWDADRLGLVRMRRFIDPSLLSTVSGLKIASVLNKILNDQVMKLENRGRFKRGQINH